MGADRVMTEQAQEVRPLIRDERNRITEIIDVLVDDVMLAMTTAAAPEAVELRAQQAKQLARLRGMVRSGATAADLAKT